MKNYNLDYQTAGTVLPALVINAAIAESFGLKSLRVSRSDYEEGLLTDLAHPDSGTPKNLNLSYSTPQN